MKISLCQLNFSLGDFQNNKEKIINNYNRSIQSGADIVVFPEMSTIGYSPQDLLWDKNFVEKNIQITNDISKISSKPIIFGCVRKDKAKLYNSAAICYDGRIQKYIDKILLPTYDVFDETRYFSSGSTPSVWDFPINGKTIKIGIQICEDLWDDDYDCKVSETQKDLGASLIINISASPYSKGKPNDRVKLINTKVNKTRLPFIYCNMVGAQDELIYDGESFVMNSSGSIIAYLNSFMEDNVIVDINSKETINIPSLSFEEKAYKALVLGLRDYFHKTNHSDAIIGLSGGIDSALVCCLAVEALGNNHVHGVYMPSKYSSNHSLKDSKELAHNLEIDYKVISIKNLVKKYDETLFEFFDGLKPDEAEQNIQSRIRGNILMALSNKFNWMVLSTGNKTELALGYCTLYGDMSGGLSVISDLNKMDVYSISNWINREYPKRIPKNSLVKVPSAELVEDQVDPFDYDVVSPLVEELVGGLKTRSELISDGFNPNLIDEISGLIRLNEFKRRQSAPGLKISRKAFGIGRRIPIVNKYKG